MADLDTIRGLIKGWLAERIPADAMSWIEERCESIAAGAPERRLFMSFSGATRYTGRAPLALSTEELAAAGAARRGWNPAGWDCGQAARTLILLSSDMALLDKLFASADMGELVALYQALPLLPDQDAHIARCAEGVRTNMTSVFCAVAHFNPYPREWLDNAAWNQMVLKALFVGVPLWPVDGLDERANPELTSMLCDYAHERWAAGRAVSPELWRCVALEADDAARADLQRAVDGDDELCAKGARLAMGEIDGDWKDLVA